MKIDSIRHFGYVLFHPFSKKVNTSTAARVGIAVLSALLIIPMAYAGASFIIGRFTKKNPKSLTATERKTQTVARTHTQPVTSAKKASNSEPDPLNSTPQSERNTPRTQPIPEYVTKVAIAMRSDNPGYAMYCLRKELPIKEILDGLDQFQANNENEIQKTAWEYREIAIDPNYRKEASLVMRSLNGIMRFKEQIPIGINEHFATISHYLEIPTKDNCLLQEHFATCFHQIKTLDNDEMIKARMDALTQIGKRGRIFELRTWAVRELVSLQDLPDTGHINQQILSILLMSIADIAAWDTDFCNPDDSWIKPLRRFETAKVAIPALMNVFKVVMAKDLDPERKNNIQRQFFNGQLKDVVTRCCLEKRIKRTQPREGVSKVLMEELQKLSKDYPEETKPFILEMSTHPGLK